MPPTNMPKATNPVKSPNEQHSQVDKHSEAYKPSEADSAKPDVAMPNVHKQPMPSAQDAQHMSEATKLSKANELEDAKHMSEANDYTPGWQSPSVDNSNAPNAYVAPGLPNMPDANLVVEHPYTVQEQQAGMPPHMPTSYDEAIEGTEYVPDDKDTPVSDKFKRTLHRNVLGAVGAMFTQHNGSAMTVMGIVRDLQQVLRIANTTSMTYDAMHNSVQSAVERYTMPDAMRKAVKPVMMAVVEYMHVLIGQERLNAVQVYVYLVEVLGWMHNAASLYHAREE